jgi:hypothetical protein
MRSWRRLPHWLVSLLVLSASIPAMAAQLTLPAVRDNTLFQDSGDNSNGAGTQLFVGTIASGSPRRGLVRFDLSSLPAGAVVTSATLRINVNRLPPRYQPQSISLHRVTASWGEGTSATDGGIGTAATPQDATWLHRFYGGGGVTRLSWTNPGGDYVSAPSAVSPPVVQIFGQEFPSTPQVLADIDAWLQNPASNHGWILIGTETGESSVNRIDSRESADPSARPRLIVSFEVVTENVDAPLPIWVWALLAGGLSWQLGRSRSSA